MAVLMRERSSGRPVKTGAPWARLSTAGKSPADVIGLLDEFQAAVRLSFPHEMDAGEMGWWFGCFLQERGLPVHVVGRLVWEAGFR